MTTVQSVADVRTHSVWSWDSSNDDNSAAPEPAPPTTYTNVYERDDPWDNDAVCWLLEQPGADVWTRVTLFEHLRRQPRLVRDAPQRVEEAAAFARAHGVKQVPGRVIHFVRTDRDAPRYPAGRGVK